MLQIEGNRLYKAEKLCSRTAVESLFAEGVSLMAYPLRAVYRVTDRGEAPAQFMISVPKKKIRRAVDRVLLRRRIREAFRLNRQILYPALCDAGKRVDVAFMYLSTSKADYHRIESKMQDLLTRIAAAVKP